MGCPTRPVNGSGTTLLNLEIQLRIISYPLCNTAFLDDPAFGSANFVSAL